MHTWLSILAAEAAGEGPPNPIRHVIDQPWKDAPQLFGHPIMSSQIATMILAGIILLAVLLLASRKRAIRPAGRGYNLVEFIVLLVRDFIARPALHEKTYRFLPFLLTLFCFILACNLLGLVPLLDISHAFTALERRPVGGTPTGSIWVTGALASMTLLVIFGVGISAQVAKFVDRGRPAALGWSLGFVLYLWSLVPDMPLLVKILMSPLLIVLEVIGVLARCFALAIRLWANMTAGHILLAVLLMFISMASGAISWLVTPASIAGAVMISLLELLVALIQAFIFTFLTAMFIGLAAHPQH
jgi:F-type H+-transporting ATPase subunit a